MKKAYVFVNSYIAGNQTGIQAAHALVRLSMKPNNDAYKHWATHDETLVILNGGDYKKMKLIKDLINDLDLVKGEFHEVGLYNPAPLTAIAYVPDNEMMQRIEEIPDMPPEMVEQKKNFDYRWMLADIIAKSRTHKG